MAMLARKLRSLRAESVVEVQRLDGERAEERLSRGW